MKFDQIAGILFARLPEKVTLANAASVRAALLEHTKVRGARMVLDLSGVEIMDSSGLSAILACVRAVRGAGGDLVLLSPMPRVMALIELTRLNDVVQIATDTDTALELVSTVVAH
jgi:anti-sigma B factor antagonist